MSVEILPITGIGRIVPGDDLAAMILDAVAGCLPGGLRDGDVVVVTHKVVSKAEGALAPAAGEAERRTIVERESAAVLRRRGELVIAETRHGFVCANAGVDRSNVEPGTVVLLPHDPDRSAQRIRTRLGRASGAEVAVIITDTFGRAWRRGLTDVAIGVAGLPAVVDLRNTADAYGNRLEVTEVALADEVAAAADLVMGKAASIPVAVVRGLAWTGPPGRGADLIRPAGEDLFR